LGLIFVILKLFKVFFLFSFDFFIICIVDVTKKKRKEKKKKYSESECMVSILFMNFFYDKIAKIKKNLIF